MNLALYRCMVPEIFISLQDLRTQLLYHRPDPWGWIYRQRLD
jgi:hypothetical protein